MSVTTVVTIVWRFTERKTAGTKRSKLFHSLGLKKKSGLIHFSKEEENVPYCRIVLIKVKQEAEAVRKTSNSVTLLLGNIV